MKVFFLTFFVHILLCVASIAIVYGHEEGTLHSDILGSFFEYVLMALKFPFAYLFATKYLLMSLLLNAILWASIVSILYRKL